MKDNENLLSDVTIEPRQPANAAVIWLHGLGADGHDFEPVVPQLHLPPELAVRFVFPHAPHQPVTINGGMVMRAWYDIAEPGQTPRQQDEAGIRRSGDALRALIGREIERGIPAQRIMLAGFSQGGAIVLHAGLRYPERLGGIMALSTYLPLADHLAGEAHAANHDVPVLMMHGRTDTIIPIGLAERSRDLLLGLGYPVVWHDYDMGHSVCPAEIDTLSDWLSQSLTRANLA